MANVKQGTLFCDVFGESLMAEKAVIQISRDGRETFVCSKDLSDKAYKRLTKAIMRYLEPIKPREKKGESDD